MQKYLLMLISCLLIAGGALATVAPKNGGKLPQAYYDRKAADRTAFTMQRAWIQKTQRIKERREAFLEANGPQALSALPANCVVTGTVNVPVFTGQFANRPSPHTQTALQNQLFDSNPSGTVSAYYNEISYGNVNLVGTVHNWVTLSQNDTYYEGINNGLGVDAHTGEFIRDILNANDGAVNFGLFDNDGPDGVPNSGDDDGYVDFVAFVHSESGGECGTSNIWSHRWVYQGWPESGGLPYTTNDAAAGGGFIRVNDYTIQPVVSCGGGIIEIGVFCHEFGHAFGLPDLYDTNGGSSGIGYWGIMGSGNWNQPSSPAHPSAWTRKELGWVVPTDVAWQGGVETVNQINTNAQAYRLGFTDDHFRRSTACAITGSYSLYCGLTQAEATVRGWASPGPTGGYGNGWMETIEREFTYSGSGTVNFSYAYDYSTEEFYDFAFAAVEVNGTETILATYNLVGSGTANHNITTYLSPLAPAGGTYTLKFRGYSDYSFSDEDGGYESTCGLIAIDDVTVTGGGESYSTGFETYVDGWHQSPVENPPTEYWLVENRQAVGFDTNLIRNGLLIMHVDDEVANSGMGNSGGSGSAVRGVVVEEADGLFHLINTTTNRGDSGDPYPGATNNTTFDTNSSPNSRDNLNRVTQVEVSSISAAGPSMTAYMKAGDLAPLAVSVSPDSLVNNLLAADVVITGDRIKHGATFYFTNPSGKTTEALSSAARDGADIVGTSLVWVDPVRLEGTVNVYSKTGGDWDLVVTNPDGRTFTLNNALYMDFQVATQLVSAAIAVIDGSVHLEFELHGTEDGESIRLYRSVVPDGDYVMIEDDLRPSGDQRYVYIDGTVEPGNTYFYRLESKLPDGEVRELHRNSATIPARDIHLSQNFPNPFNPTTAINVYLPEQTKLQLEIFDVAGRFVKRIASGVHAAGPHRVRWNGTDTAGNTVSSGVYVYRLTAGKRTISKKMILLR